MSEDLLSIYLNDHLAGATAGVDLAREIAEDTAGSTLGRVMEQLARDIEADRAVLEELIERLEFGQQTVKQAVGWMAEKMSRLRLNRVSAGSDELAFLMSLEALAMGVDGKRNLWQALQEVAAQEPAVAELDLPALVRRAEAQHDVLETHRRAAAPAALGRPEGGRVTPG
ncbi:MAG: hypothetical protein M3314_00980 [Actinomycetota bacterium]|nr:hypothetical protein [Actinomycetota bacterium]